MKTASVLCCSFGFPVLLALSLGSCSEGSSGGAGGAGGEHDHHHASENADCEEIAEACHDPGSGNQATELCHELGHTGSAEECAAEKADCLEACHLNHTASGGSAAGGAGGMGGGS